MEKKITKGLKETCISDEIRDRTGFVLEHEVATVLEKNGWNVIHNRFYLDDVQSIQREMDLLVYKSDEIENIMIYTTLIVSCKKSGFKDWVFMTRDAQATKINMNTIPFTFWTNSEIINFQLNGKKFNELENCDSEKLKMLNDRFQYHKTLFAFREYDNKAQGNKLSQDTGIYESIITLIKSQAYELESLPIRRQDRPCYYNINLLTVADVSRFIEIECNGDILNEKEIDRINYVNRFLVNRREHNSRIIFSKFSALQAVVDDFNIMHEINCELISKGVPFFYEHDIWEKWTAMNIAQDKHLEDLENMLVWELDDEIEIYANDFKHLNLTFNGTPVLQVQFNARTELIEFLNNHNKSKEITASWLNDTIRYTGSFVFAVYDLPF